MERETHYYIAQGEDVQGPFPHSKVLELIAQGRARPDMLFSEEGGAWVPGHEINDLFGGAGVSAPPQPQGFVDYSAPPSGPAPSRAAGQTRARRLMPHRGGAVLTLGILGLVICFICGIIAWVMGAEDLKQMKMGRMDRSGEGMTQAGLICGMIGTILAGVVIVIWILMAMAGGAMM